MSQKNKDNSFDIDQHEHADGCCGSGKDLDECTDKNVEAAKTEGKGLLQKAKDAGQVAIEHAKDAGQSVADSAVGAKDFLVGKARAAGAAIRDGASSAADSLISAKDVVVEKASNPGEVIDDVKEWSAVKAQQAEGLLQRIEGLLAKASETIESLREGLVQKAERLDQTLESAQGVVMRAEETLVEAHDWAKDKACRMGDVMDKTKEAIERSSQRLAAQTEELKQQGQQAMEALRQTGREIKGELRSALGQDELSQRIERARDSIRELEVKIRQLGVDPMGVRMYGTSNPDVQLLRDQIAEEEKQVSEYEEQLSRSGASRHVGPQILPEKQ